MAFANLENRVLDHLRGRVRRQRGKGGRQISQRLPLKWLRLAELFLYPHEVVIIGDRVLDEAGEQRLGLGCRVWIVTADETPKDIWVFRVRDAGEVQQHRERDRTAGMVRQTAEMDVPNRI